MIERLEIGLSFDGLRKKSRIVMRICQLELKHFRGIEHGMVSFPGHAVLLGANNTGKSTIVEALALLFGRERMVSPISDWDFFGGDPKPESRFHIIATLTDFETNDPMAVPDWFVGQEAAQPIWWTDTTQEISLETDASPGTTLATQVALAGRFDDEACEFEVVRYFYYGESDPFTDGFSAVPWRLLREVGLFLLSSNRDWDKLLAFRSSSLLKVIREYEALPGHAIDELKKQLRTDVAKIEESSPLSDIVNMATRELQSFLLIGGTSRIVYRPTSLDAISVLQSLVAHVEQSEGVLLPVARHGAGTISLQAFLLLLAFAEHRKNAGQNFILAAEEPELHLHPSLHHRLVQRIRSASTQSVVTTQSPNVAAGYQPSEVVFLSNQDGSLTAKRLRDEPIKAIPSNSVRKLYLTHRAALYEALMGGVILIPEGYYDHEWLALWQKLAQSHWPAATSFDLRPITILPTSDGGVAESFREISNIRPDCVPIIDGDDAGARYLDDLLSQPPIPAKVVRFGEGAAIECLSAWILEPALSTPTSVLKELLGDSDPSSRSLQDALINKKKDKELHEILVWDAQAEEECCERACQFFSDLASIAYGSTLINSNWSCDQVAGENTTALYTASHIRRV